MWRITCVLDVGFIYIPQYVVEHIKRVKEKSPSVYSAGGETLYLSFFRGNIILFQGYFSKFQVDCAGGTSFDTFSAADAFGRIDVF